MFPHARGQCGKSATFGSARATVRGISHALASLVGLSTVVESCDARAVVMSSHVLKLFLLMSVFMLTLCDEVESKTCLGSSLCSVLDRYDTLVSTS